MAPDRSVGDFGGKLRDARERRGISLRQIANATKISIAALEALERNDVSRLPGGIFSRAFIRSYAVEVGLDPDATIQEFVAQFPHDAVQTGHEAPLTPAHAPLGGERHLSRTFMQLVGVGLPVAAAVLYFGIGMQRASRSVETPPSTPVVEPAPPGEPPPPTPGAAPTSVLPAPAASSVPPAAPPAAG